jgi:hypothetical protein
VESSFTSAKTEKHEAIVYERKIVQKQILSYLKEDKH